MPKKSSSKAETSELDLDRDRTGDTGVVGDVGFGGFGRGLEELPKGVLVLGAGDVGVSNRDLVSRGGDWTTEPPNIAAASLTETTGSLSTLSFDF